MTRQAPHDPKALDRFVRTGRPTVLTAEQRAWSDAERDRLLTLLAAGTPIGRIAVVLRRSIDSIYCFCYRQHISIAHVRTDRVFSAREVYTMFGISQRMFHIWVASGWLHATQDKTFAFREDTPRIRRRSLMYIWRVSRRALELFVQEPAAWPSYSPAQIADAPLRQLALAARRGAGGQWESLATYAHRTGYTREAVRYQARKGLLPHPTTRISTQWYIWIPNAEAQP